MTKEEELIKHVDGLIEAFNDAYKDYRNSVVASFVEYLASWLRFVTRWKMTDIRKRNAKDLRKAWKRFVRMQNEKEKIKKENKKAEETD